MALISSIDDDSRVLTYVDGAHALNDYGKGHSGIFVKMGLGDMINVSNKLGLVTTSSTETKIVASSE